MEWSESINFAGIEFIGNYFSRAYARPVRRGIEDKDEGETGGCERARGDVMGAANEPRQARIRVERRLPLGVETKARSCRGCGRTFSTGSYTRRTQRRPRDRARGTRDEEEPLAVGSQMEDEEKAATDETRDGEREGRAREMG